MRSLKNKSHLLSVDLEDWDTSALLRKYASKENNESRLNEAVKRILILFEKKNVTATFFTLGIVAEKYPRLIKEIKKRGHEIASHGYSHTPLWYLTPEEFRDDLRRTGRVIKELTGEYPSGFRAPYASLDESTAWAVDILSEEGYKYDSSIFPMKTPLYGVRGAPRGMYRISSGDIRRPSSGSRILEVPFSVADLGFLNIPCTGGIYGRFLPLRVLILLLKRVSKHREVNFYFHPWEIQPPVIQRKHVPCFNFFLSYYNSKNYLRKISRVIDLFSFSSFENFVRSESEIRDNPGAA